MRTAVIVFNGFEDLDAFAPLNVLGMAGFDVSVVSVGEPHPVRSHHGTVVVPAGRLSDDAELLLVPGGGWMTRAPQGAWAEAQRGDLPAALARAAESGAVVTSVCTGALLVAAAGLLTGRPAVTNQSAFDELAAYGVDVVRDARVVDDGNVVTSGGLTAGIDLAIHLAGRFFGEARADELVDELEYVRQGRVHVTTRA